jgi:hypothetical protein
MFSDKSGMGVSAVTCAMEKDGRDAHPTLLPLPRTPWPLRLLDAAKRNDDPVAGHGLGIGTNAGAALLKASYLIRFLHGFCEQSRPDW